MRILAAFSVALLLAGCADYGPKELGGGAIGAGVGGLVGSKFGHGGGTRAATAGGTIIGALLGGSAGRSLDRSDRAYQRQTTSDALENEPSGGSVDWRNPDTGAAGTVTPRQSYRNSRGGYCREFVQTVTIAGEVQDAYGTACRQSDGSWQVVN